MFIVNVDWFFLSHRIEIALAAYGRGYEVYVATAITNRRDELESYGFNVIPLPLERGNSGLVNEIKAFIAIRKAVSLVKPSILHLITVKPVLYGSIIARLTKVTGVVAAVSGLGYIFTSTDKRAKFRRWVICGIYQVALEHKNLIVIFQNSDDLDSLRKHAKFDKRKTRIIQGSGVNLDKFKYLPEVIGVPTVVMASRLLSDKGVVEFMEAAKNLKSRGVAAKFLLIGNRDPDNPASISKQQILEWKAEGIVTIPGFRGDVANEFQKAHIVVLPSYREGFPKVLIEAAACGRAAITTDVPGCRDVIVPGLTGLLVPVRDSESLADAIEELVTNNALRLKMGKAARKYAEKKYDVGDVVQAHLNIYQELLSRN